MAIVFVALALAVAVISMRSSWAGPVGSLALFAGVPFAVGTASGLPLGLQPGALAVIFCLLAALAHRPKQIVSDILASPVIAAACSLFVVIAVLTTRVMAPEGMGMVVNMAIVPMVGAGLLRSTLKDTSAAVAVRRGVLVVAAAEAVVAIAVRFGLVAQPWQQQLIDAYRWYSPDFARALGTTDNPLVLVALFTMAAPLLVGVRSALLRVSVGALLVLATSITESRSGVVIVTIGVLVAVLRRGGSPWGQMITALVALGVLGLVASSNVAGTVLEKFVDDGGSANARALGWDWTLANIGRFSVSGYGAGSSYALTTALPTSLESPLFMFPPDYGLPATLLYFGAAAGLVFCRVRTARPVPGGVLAGAGTLAHIVTFSSIAAFSSVGMFLWFALALAAPPIAGPSRVAGAFRGRHLDDERRPTQEVLPC